MKKLLVISAFVPYKNVPHAGGKTHYYYLCKYAEKFDTRLVTFADANEMESAKNDLDQLNIKYSIIERKWTIREKVLNKESTLNPFNRNCRMVSNTEQIDLNKEIRKLKKCGYSPDIIILEWTQMLLACRNIRKLFPNAKIVASEHDVSFLAYERKYKKASGIKSIVKYIEYKSMLNKECKFLINLDLVLVQNQKDKELLSDAKIDKSRIQVIVPFFSHLNTSQRNNSRNILFFGAMSRKENYLSAIWFIENVFCKLIGFKFIILGGNPSPVLEKYKSKEIIITGFVDDIQPYFDDAFCFVSPLVMGGGIKVKILEAFTAGLPVLTNSIGIEGIPAKCNRDYIHCEESTDYFNSIIKLDTNRDFAMRIGANGKEFIERNFNTDASANDLIRKLHSLF